MHIRFQGDRPEAVSLEFKGLSVEPGQGAHRLGLRYALNRVGDLVDCVLLVHGKVCLVAGNERYWLGQLQATEGLPLGPAPLWPRDTELTTTINDTQLAEIVKRVGPSGLALHVDVHATLLGKSPLPWPAMGASADHHIEQAEWLKVAEQLRALIAVTFTVPCPEGTAGTHQIEAGERLKKALRALAQGRYDDAVTDARRALERLDEAAPRADLTKPPNKRERDLEQRFSALRGAVFDVAHGAVHDDQWTKDFIYTRADATAAVACAAALVARESPFGID